mmetsp:Transcript_12466/g.18941  ORF Transcript_12466/g.18941 Transcript_12466/m.18941 type:complete len:188 (-) Transcript_12466:385-948(-)
MSEQNGEPCRDQINDGKQSKSKDDDNDNDKKYIEVLDSPCWGSPQECDLLHFLSKHDHSKLVLHNDHNYLVVSKPPDLRMDGHHPSTVLKWLSYQYPTPFLLEKCSSKNNEIQKKMLLLQEVSKLEKHSHLPDNVLRPCHQLDYATYFGSVVVGQIQTSRRGCWGFFCLTHNKKGLLGIGARPCHVG